MADATRPVLRVIDGASTETAVGAATHTIRDVADACGLPQPVIAQLVPRTWTDEGWMYTAAQLQSAVGVAAAMRRRRLDPS